MGDPSTSWNVLDPKSPLRSKRVQGAFLTIAALAAQAFGINVPVEAQGEVISQTNGIFAAIGVIWNQVGALLASGSPRHF